MAAAELWKEEGKRGLELPEVTASLAGEAFAALLGIAAVSQSSTPSNMALLQLTSLEALRRLSELMGQGGVLDRSLMNYGRQLLGRLLHAARCCLLSGSEEVQVACCCLLSVVWQVIGNSPQEVISCLPPSSDESESRIPDI